MNLTGLGDRAHLFNSQRQGVGLRTRLATLTDELATGQASDVVAHLNGDTAPLADLDHRIALAESYGTASREVGNRLAIMQTTLGQVEDLRASLAAQVMSPSTSDVSNVAVAASRSAFDDIVAALNTRLGPDAIFAGTQSSPDAVASARTMMASIGVAVAGATTAGEVAARLDTWFDSPAGGFATTSYKGSNTDMTRSVDKDTMVTIGVRADTPALRGLLKAAAMGALAGSSALAGGEGAKLISKARDGLLSLSAPLTEVRSAIGQAQAHVEEATARHAARSSAWRILRTEMTEKDPYGTASEVEALRTQLQSHYELTSRLSSLNLASFLR